MARLWLVSLGQADNIKLLIARQSNLLLQAYGQSPSSCWSLDWSPQLNPNWAFAQPVAATSLRNLATTSLPQPQGCAYQPKAINTVTGKTLQKKKQEI